MGQHCGMSRAFAFAVTFVLAAADTAFAAGGVVALRTDNGADGYYYGLRGTGADRFINEYRAGTFEPGTIICGARWRELNHGTIPPPGIGGGDLRLEDAANPGYPNLAGGLVATVDPASQGTCAGGTTRLFTFGGGAGVPDPVVTNYVSAIEPVHGTGGTDFCGTLLDTSSASQGFARVYSGGVFGVIPWNHFIEAIVVTPKRMDLNVRASGSARFPGDRGIPVVFTDRPNAAGSITDDNITLSISIDNGTGALVGRHLEICADRSVIAPEKGLTPIKGYFRPVGGGGAIMNPLVLPPGRTVLKLEVSTASVKQKAANVVNKRALNLPLRVLVDDPFLDTDACALDAGEDVDDEVQELGLRRRAGSADDGTMEAFFVVQSPSRLGDSLNVRFKAIDLPRVAYDVTGFEVVGGEFGGSGLPGLDAVELRAEDPIFGAAPDLSPQGLVRSFGSVDGIGEVPLGPAPATAVLDTADVPIDPAAAPHLATDLFVLGVLLPDETVATTSIGVDAAPADTILGDTSFTVSGLQPNTYTLENAALRLLLGGDRATLAPGAERRATAAPGAFSRPVGTYVAIDREGRRLIR